MIIAITSSGNSLEDTFEKSFGRSPFFLFYDTETKNISSKNNEQNLLASQGAGIQSAQQILDAHAEILITGHCGPKAYLLLQSAGIKVYCTDVSTVKVAIEQYLQGSLSLLDQANVTSRWS